VGARGVEKKREWMSKMGGKYKIWFMVGEKIGTRKSIRWCGRMDMGGETAEGHEKTNVIGDGRGKLGSQKLIAHMGGAIKGRGRGLKKSRI